MNPPPPAVDGGAPKARPVSPGPRPERLVLVVGTATEVGKTHLCCRLLEHARQRGVRVAARKPAQSFEDHERGGTDAELLARASSEPVDAVCPPHRWYSTPMAPPMASDRLGLSPIRLADLASELTWPTDVVDLGFVETAGGVRSPLAHDGDAADLARLLDPDVILLVSDAGLGTLNSTLLSAGAMEPTGVRLVVALNHFDPREELHRLNFEWLTAAGIEAIDAGELDLVLEAIRTP